MWELDHKESWAPKNWCFWTVVLEKTLESPLDSKIQPVNPRGNQCWILKDWCWSWNSNTLATWCKELIHWKRPWCWERLKTGGEGDDRGWDSSPTRWTWVWASSGSWWWTGKPGVLQSIRSQRVRHDWVTELNWSWWLLPLRKGLWTLLGSSTGGSCSLLAAVNLGGHSFLPLGYWHAFCLTPDTFVYFYHCYQTVPTALSWGLPPLIRSKKKKKCLYFGI